MVFSTNGIYGLNPDNSDLINFLSGGLIGGLALHPDNQQIIFSGRLDSLNADLYLLSKATNELVNLTNSPQQETDLDWSPDGQQIVFVSTDQLGSRLMIMDRSGQNSRMLIDLDGNESAPSWSPDG